MRNVRDFCLSSSNGNFFQNLFSHFQFSQKAKKVMKERRIDLSNLTAEQELKLKPVLRLRMAFRVVNVIMGSMGVVAVSVWYFRRKKELKCGKQVEDEYHPVWLDLKYFKHKGALINNYLLPEQIVGKLKELKKFEFRCDDCVCASFPKSGTTLLQELVFLIQTDFNYELAQQNDLSQRYAFLEWPNVHLQQISCSNEKRFLKTHLPPIFFNQSFSKAKIIYIYRNPKDVTVSLFHFLRSINIELTYSGPWDQFVKSFIIDEVYYAPWCRHVNDFHSLGDSICFIAYEDLLTNFRETVRRLATFLGKEKELTEDKLDELQKWCSFESMKNNSKVNYSWFNHWGFVKKSFQFFRKGQIGDWLNHFDIEQSKEFDEMVRKRVSPLVPRFNYGISVEDQNDLYKYYENKQEKC